MSNLIRYIHFSVWSPSPIYKLGHAGKYAILTGMHLHRESSSTKSRSFPQIRFFYSVVLVLSEMSAASRQIVPLSFGAFGSHRSQGPFFSRGGRKRSCSVRDNREVVKLQLHFWRNSIGIQDLC